MEYTRVFIEKKNQVDIRSIKLLEEFKGYLGISNLKEVRIINIYDLINMKQEETKTIINHILYEPETDVLYTELPTLDNDERAFRVQYLKGQFNKREEAVRSLAKILNVHNPQVAHSKVIVLKGISNEELEKIKFYYINPIEMEEIDIDKFTYEEELDESKEIEVIEGFGDLNLSDLESFKSKHGIGMDMEDLEFCQGYFKQVKRDPSITEIKLIDTYWSDHCRHTTFMTEITDIEIEEGKYKPVFEAALEKYLSSRDYVYGDTDRPICLMDLGTINMKEISKKGLLDDKEESEEINAASIEIDVDIDGEIEQWLLMFKNETHNHPTEMEPFGGAATCLGGAIRDPLSGRSFAYQAMRISGSADPRKKYEDTLVGKLPQRKITQGAMEGYSSYGNEVGVATGYVREVYDEGFLAKRFECGALVAAVPKDWVYRGKAEPGDLVILVGGRTGRDGLGGAVGSSQEHTEKSLHTSSAEVQKGNPSLERKILKLFRQKKVSKMIKTCNDFGAGGVGVAIGELADGLIIDLDKVPLKYPGLDGTEIALSESQERMAVVIDKKNLDDFMKEVVKEDLEGTLVAKVTEEKVLKMNWRGNEIVNIDRDFLGSNGIRKKSKAKLVQPSEDNFLDILSPNIENQSIEESILGILKDINIGSQKGIIENFDNTVGNNAVLMPYGGKYMLSPSEAMVGKIPVLKGNTNTCSIMSHGYEPKIGNWSPFHGGYYAVIESIARIVALGGDYRKIRLSLQEYFERLEEDKIKWGKSLASLLGAYLVQKELDIPSIGGKDSMSGTFEDIHVPPTLISFGVTSEKVDNIISNEFKNSNNNVVLIPLDIDDKGLIDFQELKSNYAVIKKLIDEKLIISAQSIRFGGIGRAICEMAFGNKIGFRFNHIEKDDLFKPLFGSIIVEISEDLDLEEIFKDINYKLLGQTIYKEEIQVNDEVLDLNKLIHTWESPLEGVFPIADKNLLKNKEIKEYRTNQKFEEGSIAKPKVLIPIFTGTHGEYTMAQAFEKAGGDVETYVFKSLVQKYIQESFKELGKKIEQSQILGFPHGSVLGNEPESGGKQLKLILNNPYIREKINEHLEEGGLILGIGDGFQGLLKAGLILNNEEPQLDEHSIYISQNKSGRFLSTMVDVKVKSNISPWMSDMEVGHVYTAPVGTMEGRIIVENKNILENGQVATEFVNDNPTGSFANIEALTSLDGRVLGTTAAIDRVGEGLYKNIDIKGEHNIFESGIKYFK